MSAEAQPVVLTKGTPGVPCPIAKTIDLIGTKWTFLIVRDLLIEGTLRFGDLLRSLEGISPKTLSLRLRELEEHGLIKRTVYPEVPPRVEYELTDKGRQLRYRAGDGPARHGARGQCRLPRHYRHPFPQQNVTGSARNLPRRDRRQAAGA
jgi:DNA-binding HxlR family transcriptional regulator